MILSSFECAWEALVIWQEAMEESRRDDMRTAYWPGPRPAEFR